MKRIKALIITLIISVGTLSLLYSQGAVATQHLSSGAIDALGREVSLSKPINTIVVAGKAALMPADALFLFPLAMEKEVILAKTDQGLGDFFPLIKPEIASSVRLGQQVGP